MPSFDFCVKNPDIRYEDLSDILFHLGDDDFSMLPAWLAMGLQEAGVSPQDCAGHNISVLEGQNGAIYLSDSYNDGFGNARLLAGVLRLMLEHAHSQASIAFEQNGPAGGYFITAKEITFMRVDSWLEEMQREHDAAKPQGPRC